MLNAPLIDSLFPWHRRFLWSVVPRSMKINCPACGHELAAADIGLDTGWAKCSACNEVFSLSAVLPTYGAGAAPAGPVERPFDAWPILERDRQRLMLNVPAHGMGAGQWVLLVFALVWLTFIAFWTAGALGMFFGAQFDWVGTLFAAFSIPFWIAGFGMLVAVVWTARGTRTLYLDAGQMLTELRCGPWRRRRIFDRADVQHARKEVITKTNEDGKAIATQPAVDVVHTGGFFRIPCSHEAEQAWLVYEINDFLETTPYRPLTGAELFTHTGR